MKNQGGDDLPMSYWCSLVRHDAHHYLLRLRNPAAFIRSTWTTVAHRNNVERCQDCGRQYPSWVAPDELYRRVKGNAGGQFCPGCFDRRAEHRGISLVWCPEERTDFAATCERIGAFR